MTPIINEEQFQLTPAVIEAKRNELQQVPFEELAEMFRIKKAKIQESFRQWKGESVEQTKRN